MACNELQHLNTAFAMQNVFFKKFAKILATLLNKVSLVATVNFRRVARPPRRSGRMHTSQTPFSPIRSSNMNSF